MLLKKELCSRIAIFAVTFLVLSSAYSISGESSPKETEESWSLEKKLVKILRRQASEGNADAQNNLAKLYYYGDGVEQSYEEAVQWLQKAAYRNHAEAQYILGTMHILGKGVAKNEEEARKYFNLACENGYALGCANMVTYVSDDIEKSMYYHSKACELGYRTSCGMLKLDEKKFDEAKIIFQEECDRGDANACKLLPLASDLAKKVSHRENEKNEIDKAFSNIIYINIAFLGAILLIFLVVKFVQKVRKRSVAAEQDDNAGDP